MTQTFAVLVHPPDLGNAGYDSEIQALMSSLKNDLRMWVIALLRSFLDGAIRISKLI